MKIINWLKTNIFFLFTIFLLAFIPLFPKLPLVGLTHVNVYVRAEDFIVLFMVIIYLIQIFRKKESFKTPLTIAILAFWMTGFLSTILGLIFIFPHLNDPTITSNPQIYTRNAFLFYARHIEYMSLFFIAYSGVKNKKNINFLVPVIIGTFLIVVLYGFGQRFIPQKFPAFSTMNEEFAKGIPLVLDAAGRIQSTFAGHYDFAAYLVMLIPLIGSLIFGYRNWFARFGLLTIDILAFIALLMTQSRTSFFMYLLSVIFMLIFQKQKKWIIPVIIISFVLLRTFTGLYSRYAATFSVVNRIVDARTGKVIGYGDKVNGKFVVNNVQPSGHDLYAGSLSTKGKNIGSANNLTIKTKKGNSKSIDIQNLQGNFIIQKASALDASATTRLQAEWPNAIRAFNRDPLFGSGYSSITLATDGNYFRFLGETGLLGFGIFGLIFLTFSIYVSKILPEVDSALARSFIIGVSAGIFGLGLNATLIDVFESSKIAYVLWLLVGSSVAILDLYRRKTVSMSREIIKVLTSIPSLVMYLIALAIVIFGQMINNFFVADDFTWLRWVTDCANLMQKGVASCSSKVNVITSFFLHSSDFFYRPGMKTYFYLLYNSPFGGLSPVMYHVVSLSLHLATTVLVFLISQRILKNKLFSFLSALLFLSFSSHAEVVIWISAVGHLFASFFTLLALWLYMKWGDQKNKVYLILSVLSVFLAPLFHEFGIVAPIIVVFYGFISAGKGQKRFGYLNKLIFAFPLALYFLLKIISQSLWSAGDYKYNILKLPLNIFGNLFGSIGYIFVGTPFLDGYFLLRNGAKGQIPIIIIFIFLLTILGIVTYRLFFRNLEKANKKVISIGILLFLIPLLPFLGLGNIAPRYTYLSSFGLLLLLSYALNRTYLHFISRKKYLAMTVIIMPLLYIFLQFNLLQKENSDWQHAGNITNNFMQFMNDSYEESTLGEIKKPVFYFVNVPQRYKSAWVLPVGIDDATWFEYRDRGLKTYSLSSTKDARTKAFGIKNARVFVFDNDGNIAIAK